MNFTEMYQHYFDTLTWYCMKMTGSRSAAEDITQEAFMRAMKESEKFGQMEDAAQRAWLNRTARNIFIDQARRRASMPVLSQPETEEMDLTVLSVKQALDQLEPAMRQLVILRYFAGFNSAEIGKLMHMPPPTVRTRLRSAAKQLKKYYL